MQVLQNPIFCEHFFLDTAYLTLVIPTKCEYEGSRFVCHLFFRIKLVVTTAILTLLLYFSKIIDQKDFE